MMPSWQLHPTKKAGSYSLLFLWCTCGVMIVQIWEILSTNSAATEECESVKAELIYLGCDMLVWAASCEIRVKHFLICVCFCVLQTAPPSSRPIQQPPLSTKEEVTLGTGEFMWTQLSHPKKRLNIVFYFILHGVFLLLLYEHRPHSLSACISKLVGACRTERVHFVSIYWTQG